MGKIQERLKKGNLRSLEQEYENAKKEIRNLGYVIPGTIIERRYRCGKQTCRCFRDPTKLHGPYCHWTRKIKGKTVSINLDKKTAERLSEYNQNNRKLRKIVDDLRRISMKAVRLIENREDI